MSTPDCWGKPILLVLRRLRRRFRVQMSFDTVLEPGIEGNGRVVWVVNNFKGLELKYRALTAFINLDTVGIACDSLHIKKRTGLSGVKPASVTKKCDNDVRLGFLWASAGLRFS